MHSEDTTVTTWILELSYNFCSLRTGTKARYKVSFQNSFPFTNLKKKRFCELLFGSPEHALEPSEFLLPFSLVFLLKNKKNQETSGMQMSSLVS